jgi:hypothetical protein
MPPGGNQIDSDPVDHIAHVLYSAHKAESIANPDIRASVPWGPAANADCTCHCGGLEASVIDPDQS